MREDRLLNLLLKKGTSVAKPPGSINRAAAINPSVFAPKASERYIQMPPAITPVVSAPRSTFVDTNNYLTTETGLTLTTEDNTQIIL